MIRRKRLSNDRRGLGTGSGRGMPSFGRAQFHYQALRSIKDQVRLSGRPR